MQTKQTAFVPQEQQRRLALLSSKLLDSDGLVTEAEIRRWSTLCFRDVMIKTYLKFALPAIPVYFFAIILWLAVNAQIYGTAAIFQAPVILPLAAGNLVWAQLSLALGALYSFLFCNRFTDIHYPESLYLNPSGLAFGEAQRHIPWDKIQVAQIKRLNFRGLRQGDVLELYIDRQTYRQTGLRTLRADNRIHFLDPVTQQLVDDDYEGVCIRLPLELLAFDADRQKLFKVLSENIAEGVLQGELTLPAGETEGESYTAMWLDELRAPQNANTNRVLPVGQKLHQGLYTINSVIGYGGFSVVYTATTSTGIKVAIKELMINSGGTRASKEHILSSIASEVGLLKTLNHPNIVKCLDFFMDRGRVYIIMQALQGLNLRDYVNQKGALSLSELLVVGRQCCSILTYLHNREKPLIHRDFTPDNLIWDGHSVRLIDFNVAEEINTSGSQSIVGKHCFLAPEQWCGNFSTAGDLYQLGCTLYFLATAQDPEPLKQSLPQVLRPELPLAFCQIVSKLTERDVENRFSTADEVAQKLDEAGGA